MSNPNRRERERESRRRRFIDIAERRFLRRGYEGTSLDEVADQAEFSKRTLYLYFENKWELFMAVVERSLERLAEDVAATEDGSPAALDQLADILNVHFDFRREHPERYRTIQIWMARAPAEHGNMTEIGPHERGALRQVEEIERVAIRALDRGLVDGTVPGSLETTDPLVCLLGSVWGILGMLDVREMGRESQVEAERQADEERLFRMWGPAAVSMLFKSSVA